MTASIEGIARRHYETEAADIRLTPGSWLGLLGLLVPVAAVILGILSVVLESVSEVVSQLVVQSTAGVLLLLWLISLPVSRLLARRRASRGLAAFRAGDLDAVRPVYELAVREFREQIKTHRARTLGANSEWAIARGSLATRADDAQRSVAYWRARVREEPGNQLAATQLKTALGIDGKVRSALVKLDAKADALLRFYNDCEAKLALMDRYSSDLDETRRLEELSGTTDVAITNAESTLAAIGEQFVREAQAVGRALSGLERVQIKSLAGEASLDNIEYLADRIIESSDAERRAVENLDKALNQI